MTIYTENAIIAVKHGPFDSERVRELVDAIVKKRERGYENWFFDGRETSEDDPNAVMWFCPKRLPPLNHFRVCDKNANVWKIRLHLNRQYSSDILKRWIAFCPELPRSKVRGLVLTCFVNHTGLPNEGIYGEYIIGVRWGSAPQFDDIRLDLSKIGKEVPTEMTQSFLVQTIADAGLTPWVTVKPEEHGYEVYGEAPWRVEAINRNQQWKSPVTLRVGPFESFRTAWERAERALHGPAVKRIDNLSLSLSVNPVEYEILRERFNKLASGWEVELYGSYADSIDPYTADASQSPDGRFPIFMWRPARDANGLYYQANIVPTPEGRYLEIHSNCGDMKKLLKEAESTTGVKFTPVEAV